MGDLDDLMAAADADRIRELEKKISAAREGYYNGRSKWNVTDAVYDAWVDELAQLKPSSPAVTAIGAPPPVSEWKKVAHGIPMGSLDKVNTVEELHGWYAKVAGSNTDLEDLIPGSTMTSEPLLVTEKLDGISIHVRYVSGMFTQALTRGDGVTGEDITQNVRKMQGFPAELPGFTGSVRGEIILTKSAHVKHFPDKANPRNAAAGTSKRYDGNGCEHLTVMFYHVAEGHEFEHEHEAFEWLGKVGFNVPYWQVPFDAVHPVNGCVRVYDEYQASKREALDYDIDGLVVRLDNLSKQIALGENDGRPVGAVAFKFTAAARESICRDIQGDTAGTGVITPVCVFDPVMLVGAEVTRASLYNWKNIRELKLNVGATILVARANDVIPKVVEVVTPTGTIAKPPTHCKSCGAETTWDGEYLICPNTTECPAQTVGRIERYVKGLGILEWGETLIVKLVEAGLVKTPADLYRLKLDDIAGIERMGEKSAENVLNTLWARNPIALEDLLGSMSIPLCAASTIRTVMDAGYDTWEKIQKARVIEFSAITGMGPERSNALAAWVNQQGHLVGQLLEAGVKIKERKVGALTGLSFCFTGKSEMKREDLIALVGEHGGNVKSSVTKGLSYLVMADANSNTTKAQAARKNGTRVLSEDEFLRMVRP